MDVYESRWKRLASRGKDYLREYASDLPGFCYCARLDDGRIKIGESLNEKNMGQRCLTLSRQLGQFVRPIHIFRGGPLVEATLHYRFEHLNIEREFFREEDELAEFMESPDIPTVDFVLELPPRSQYAARVRFT